MSAGEIAFYIFSVIAVISAILVVTLRGVMHSALFLAVSLLSVAGIFVLLNADFLAVVQILLYVGGIMVLILFAVMLTQKVVGVLAPQTNEQKWGAIVVCIIIFVLLTIAIRGTSFTKIVSTLPPKTTTPELGKLLVTVYALPFEIASVVLLVAMIGVIALARKVD